MFAGHAIGTAVAIAGGWGSRSRTPPARCARRAINVAVTRTVIATPIVLASLSGRPDTLPTLLVASLVSLWVTADESVIKDARKRWLRVELGGVTRWGPVARHRAAPLAPAPPALHRRAQRAPGSAML